MAGRKTRKICYHKHYIPTPTKSQYVKMGIVTNKTELNTELDNKVTNTDENEIVMQKPEMHNTIWVDNCRVI